MIWVDAFGEFHGIKIQINFATTTTTKIKQKKNSFQHSISSICFYCVKNLHHKSIFQLCTLRIQHFNLLPSRFQVFYIFFELQTTKAHKCTFFDFPPECISNNDFRFPTFLRIKTCSSFPVLLLRIFFFISPFVVVVRIVPLLLLSGVRGYLCIYVLLRLTEFSFWTYALHISAHCTTLQLNTYIPLNHLPLALRVCLFLFLFSSFTHSAYSYMYMRNCDISELNNCGNVTIPYFQLQIMFIAQKCG